MARDTMSLEFGCTNVKNIGHVENILEELEISKTITDLEVVRFSFS